MKLRIKGTNMWGELIGENESTVTIELIDGTFIHPLKSEITNLTITEYLENFMWSVFAENGSRLNQAKFFGITIGTGVIIGALLFYK